MASGHTRVRLGLLAWGRGGALHRVRVVAPQAHANRVAYRYRGLSEWFLNGPLGLEQGFDVARRPAGDAGALRFVLSLSADARPRLDGSAVRLGALRYGGLRVTDARGRVLRSWLELTAGRPVVGVDDRGARYPLRVDPFIQQAELSASDVAASDLLGFSVAVSGNTVVVGAQQHKVGNNTYQGAAYVFTMPSSGWPATATQTAELTASDGFANEFFGSSVAVSGDTVVVGAPGQAGSNNSQGAAYVFVMPSGGWPATMTQTSELTASDGVLNDELGSSVAASGNTVVAGAPAHKVGLVNPNGDQGAAYVFVKPSGGWPKTMTQTSELTASDDIAFDYLSASVAVSGTTVVAGATGRTVNSKLKQGAAYVFVMPSDGWPATMTQTSELTASDGAANDSLGISVAVSGNTVVAGPQTHKVGTKSGQGAAYVFVMPSDGWPATMTQTSELTASDGAANDSLGEEVAVSGNTVVAGAQDHEVGINPRQGEAYVFVMPSGGWPTTMTDTSKLTASDGAAQDELGFSVAVSGNTIVAGAWLHGGHGAAYVFTRPGPSVSIGSPVNGATYRQGQVVDAAFSCADAADGPGVRSCTGTVANGARINTARLGTHTVTVTATDDAGQSATRTATYHVVAVKPVVGSVRQTHDKWREGSKLATISSTHKRRRKPPVGTTFSFTLNENAIVTFAFTRQATGRRSGRKCVAPSRQDAKHKACKRTITAATLKLSGHTGTNRVAFQGRLTRSRRLQLGRYTLIIAAANVAGKSATKRLTFTIVR